MAVKKKTAGENVWIEVTVAAKAGYFILSTSLSVKVLLFCALVNGFRIVHKSVIWSMQFG